VLFSKHNEVLVYRYDAMSFILHAVICNTEYHHNRSFDPFPLLGSRAISGKFIYRNPLTDPLTGERNILPERLVLAGRMKTMVFRFHPHEEVFPFGGGMDTAILDETSHTPLLDSRITELVDEAQILESDIVIREDDYLATDERFHRPVSVRLQRVIATGDFVTIIVKESISMDGIERERIVLHTVPVGGEMDLPSWTIEPLRMEWEPVLWADPGFYFAVAVLNETELKRLVDKRHKAPELSHDELSGSDWFADAMRWVRLRRQSEEVSRASKVNFAVLLIAARWKRRVKLARERRAADEREKRRLEVEANFAASPGWLQRLATREKARNAHIEYLNSRASVVSPIARLRESSASFRRLPSKDLASSESKSSSSYTPGGTPLKLPSFRDRQARAWRGLSGVEEKKGEIDFDRVYDAREQAAGEVVARYGRIWVESIRSRAARRDRGRQSMMSRFFASSTPDL